VKILVLGAGVIGTTYAWQLSQAGADVTLWVRPERKAAIERDGIRLDCIDLRGRRTLIDTIYRPSVVSDLLSGDVYDLILVSVSVDKLEPALELIAEKAGSADILFLQNTWGGPETFDKYLHKDQYFFGYPFKAGGCRDDHCIRSVIFGNPLTATMLGEKDGQVTLRVRRAANWLAKAGMSPTISCRIIPYLWTHYAWAAATIGAYLKAGSFEAFVNSPKSIQESYLAMRECFSVCRKRGADVRVVFPNNLFALLPLPLLVPITQRIYNTPEMKRMFDGHVQHSPGEMKRMYFDMLETGRSFGIEMPIYQGFQSCIDSSEIL